MASGKKPPRSRERAENDMISLSMDLAEKQLRDGTASSQVITHFLKLGTTNNLLEQEKLKNENLLLKTKVDVLESAKKTEKMFAEAIAAMGVYQGNSNKSDVPMDD